jgi:hypothetical protein
MNNRHDDIASALPADLAARLAGFVARRRYGWKLSSMPRLRSRFHAGDRRCKSPQHRGAPGGFKI